MRNIPKDRGVEMQGQSEDTQRERGGREDSDRRIDSRANRAIGAPIVVGEKSASQEHQSLKNRSAR